ncbi:MAG: nucleotidyltransferase family protein [Desulfomonilaceae bacterium]
MKSEIIFSCRIVTKNMIDAILLAAGLSTRMGTDKTALKISGRTILANALDQAVKSGLSKIIVVTRRPIQERAAEHEWGCEKERIVNIINRKPESGMSYSIKTGMSVINETADGVMIILADQVGLDSSVIDKLVSAFFENPGKIIVPTIKDRRTTPVIFPARFFSDLRELTGDKGGREIINSNTNLLKTVEFANDYDDHDIDTAEDYLRIISRKNRD